MEVTFYPGTTTNHMCRCVELNEHPFNSKCCAVVSKQKEMCGDCENDHQEEEYD